jgi:predicted DNA-binding protein
MKTIAPSPNIRISLRSKAVLRALAKREGKPMQAVLDEAIEHYQRDKFLDEVNAAYATLRNDAVAWKEELAERALWDNAIADGLNHK